MYGPNPRYKLYRLIHILLEIDRFCEAQLGSTEEKMIEKYFVMNVIQSAMQERLSFDQFRIAPYGSTISGFSNKYSDLDMCLMNLDGQQYPNFDSWKTTATGILSQLYQALNTRGIVMPDVKVQVEILKLHRSLQIIQKCKSIIRGIEGHKLVKARHPIIVSKYNYMDMEFDLSYSDPSVVEMSRLHNLYASESENIRRMISILRIWAKVNNLTEHGLTKKLTPYILTQARLFHL